ncbi:MAG TPA: XdhC/CoxI family protein [Chryseolinea sp.]|nr:XdhC/CoxI family protein [Chryseolinea sp.]
MKEFKSILKELEKVDLSARRAALATVVQVRGSSYRSPGARMLITDDGRWVGSISGGCLEGDALRQARQVMIDKVPQTVTYDTREGSNQNLGISLGCNGVIDVLIEPLDIGDSLATISSYRQLVTAPSPRALATVFAGPENEIGRKVLCGQDSSTFGNVTDIRLFGQLEQDLQRLLQERASQARRYEVDGLAYDVFVELIQPAVSLILFGGGFDARPVSTLAKTLGWDVTVTDECVAHIAPLFFPTADKLSLCQRSFIDRDFHITTHTACVLMSHNYEYDRDVLKKLLGTPTPFIGILGPRKRFDKMLAEYAQEGLTLSEEDYSRIHSPVGLDIGAEAADEIAVAIIAEIQGKFSNREGGFLKFRTGPIHERDTMSDQVFKQLYIN